METASKSAHALSHALRSAVADLESIDSWLGLGRFVSLGVVFLSFVWLAWSTPHWLLFVGYTAIAGVFYAFWLVCTHDMVHYTLTGWKPFDEWMPRLISYPMLWPYATYAHLHRLHHAWNGIDLRDPERVQWTETEYQQATSIQRWYVRHQWVIDIGVFGGLGLIVKTVHHALRLKHQFPVLLGALLGDGLGMLVMQMSFGLVAVLHHRFIQYLLFWLVLERVIGVFLQARDHLEHYGLWCNGLWQNDLRQTPKGHQLTQLYACRNLNTPIWAAWLMGGLNDHAVHHAFPGIPFNRLAEAFDRTQLVLQQYDFPELSRGDGYIRETIRLGGRSILIHE